MYKNHQRSIFVIEAHNLTDKHLMVVQTIHIKFKFLTASAVCHVPTPSSLAQTDDPRNAFQNLIWITAERAS